MILQMVSQFRLLVVLMNFVIAVSLNLSFAILTYHIGLNLIL